MSERFQEFNFCDEIEILKVSPDEWPDRWSGGHLEVREYLLGGGFRGQAMEVAELVRLAVFDEVVFVFRLNVDDARDGSDLTFGWMSPFQSNCKIYRHFD